jgi:hypothetical protein
MKVPVKSIVAGVIVVLLLVLLKWSTGINDSGHRTIIQYPTGQMVVKFDPGLYFTFFGKETVYNDVITFDFDDSEAEGVASLDQAGISVRYQDGGTGTIYGKARFQLPADEQSMLELHKAFRTNEGVAHKLIKPVSEEGMNLTAGLMTSEEAYTEKRGTFTQWSKDQIGTGKYVTESKEVTTEDAEGKKVTKMVPVIKVGEDGRIEQIPSDLATYGVAVTGYQIADWDFEPKTLEQIAAKREATMAIITARAQAEQARQEEITTEAKGKAEVMKAKYEVEVEKERAMVTAEQEKEVALIAAEKEREQATVAKEKAQIELETEEINAEAVRVSAEAEAYARQVVLEADGALQQKLEAEIEIQKVWAEAFAQRQVPMYVFGGSGNGSTSVGANDEVSTFLQLMTVEAAKRLNYDRSIEDPTPAPINRTQAAQTTVGNN